MVGEIANIETARRAHKTLLAGEFDSGVLAPDVVYEQHYGLTAGRYVGEAGIRRWIENLHEGWHHIDGELEDPRMVGLSVVTRFWIQAGAHPESGLHTVVHGSAIYRFGRDGRVTRIEAFDDPDRAQEVAAGF